MQNINQDAIRLVTLMKEELKALIELRLAILMFKYDNSRKVLPKIEIIITKLEITYAAEISFLQSFDNIVKKAA